MLLLTDQLDLVGPAAVEDAGVHPFQLRSQHDRNLGQIGGLLSPPQLLRAVTHPPLPRHFAAAAERAVADAAERDTAVGRVGTSDHQRHSDHPSDPLHRQRQGCEEEQRIF